MIIAIRHFPDRKRPCLVCQQGNQGTVVATFRSDEEVELFAEYLGFIIGEEKGEQE